MTVRQQQKATDISRSFRNVLACQIPNQNYWSPLTSLVAKLRDDDPGDHNKSAEEDTDMEEIAAVTSSVFDEFGLDRSVEEFPDFVPNFL